MKKILGVLLSCLATFSAAQATPFVFKFQDTVGGWAPCYLNGTCPLIPGVSVGDLITVSVTADNGQANLESQSWYQSDVIFATATVGSYFGEFRAPFHNNDPLFGTDGTGKINRVWFYDTDLGNPDSLGNSVELSSNALASTMSNGSIQYWAFFQRGQSNSNAYPEYWTVSEVKQNIPAPGTIFLILAGTFGMVGAGYRYRSEKPRGGSNQV